MLSRLKGSRPKLPEKISDDLSIASQEVRHAAATPFVTAAETARRQGTPQRVVALLQRQAEQAAEKAATELEANRVRYIDETFPVVLQNLAQFHRTRKPQMLINTEPHPFNGKLFDATYAAAGTMRAAESSEGQVEIPEDVQALLGLEEPQIGCRLFDTALPGGGSLLQLHYTLVRCQADQAPIEQEQIMLLAVPQPST